MRRTKRAQALVEMCLMMPLLMLVIVGGVIDFGLAFYNLLTLQQLANDSAQWAAESNGSTGVTSLTQVQGFVNGKKPSYWASANLTVAYNRNIPLATSATGGKAAQVTITYMNPFFTPLYQAGLQVVSGKPSLPLSVRAVYQIPQIVTNR
ncbi:MAG: TadE/TadG family type IV pilus assembly protein [Candidatus Ozemobacteraceae bacterium]